MSGSAVNGPWAELLSVALLGTDRRVDTDPGALLDRAVSEAVRARAGRRPVDVDLPTGAPDERRPLVSRAAALRLERMLDGDHQRHLGAWLSVAASRGWRVPPELLPELFDRGARDRSLRPALATVSGSRGAWLAGIEPSWAYVLDETAADSDEVWELGRDGERRGFLRRLREVDPARARELLADVWRSEGAPARTAFLSVFATGLGPGDEAFLETALDDRSEKVRAVAADLLTRLPGSVYSERVIARALPLLRIDEGRLVVAPDAPAPAELRELLGRVDPVVWADRLGRAAADLVATPIDEVWEPFVREAWARATRVFERADWARALLDVDPMVGVVLPVREMQDHAARRVSSGRLDDTVIALLTAVPAPWTGALGAAVVGVLRMSDPNDRRIVHLTDLATDRLDPAFHDRFDPESRLAADLFFRHHMLKELE